MNELLDKLNNLNEFTGMPTVVLDLMGLISEPGTTTRDLVKRLERDESLAAYLLRQCNSAAYGIREEIRSLQQAVTLLGYSRLKMTFSDYMMRNLYHLGQASEEQLRLWKHATAVAVFNRTLSSSMKLNEEEVYLAGLLHDIGRLAIYHLDRPGFSQFHQLWLQKKGEDVTRLERGFFGHSHDQVGNLLLERWGVSEYLKEVVRYHHNALRYQGGNKTVALTALSNAIIHNLYDDCGYALTDLMENCSLSLSGINALIPAANKEIEAVWSLS